MNARIFYAAAPLALLLATAVQAQTWYQPPLDMTQGEQNAVYRTIIRENTIPDTRPVARQTTRQVIRTPSGRVVRTTTTERLDLRNAPIMAADERVVVRPRVERRVVVTRPQTTFVTADAIDLSQDQRTVVYRSLVQPAPFAAPVARPWLAPDQRIISAYDPMFGQRVITTAPVTTTGVGTIVATNDGYSDLVIGARIPATIPVYRMSPAAAAAAPSIAGYNYALIGNRVYLIDPRDGIVVAMLYQ